MNFLKVLQRINLKSFWSLFKLCITNPFFVIPTIKATKECILLSTKHFGRLHYQNTPANAFRHAFWNVIIAKKCTNWSKNLETVLKWSKNITDWHENAFRNRALARKMDLHNNKVGRAIFKKHQQDSLDNIIQLLIEMTKQSIKITEQTILDQHQFTLVHITD